MRKPRDIDAELKSLQDRQKQLRAKRVTQLGELVAATGAAEAFDPETLAGALLEAVERACSDPETTEAWRTLGEALFRRERRTRSRPTAELASGSADEHATAPADTHRAAAE